jgi:predicted metal-binding membrane protein
MMNISRGVANQPDREMEPSAGAAAPADRKRPAGFALACGMVFGLSVAATIYFGVSMSGGMDMPGGWTMSMMWMRMPGQSWLSSAAMFLLMWQSMMVAMMLPSALPMLLRYHGTQYALMVATGYFFVWFLVGLPVYAAGMLFALAAMESAGFSRAVPVMSGAALVIAGTIQFSPWKMRGLRRCRNLQGHTAMRTIGKKRIAWRHGLKEGVSCAVCSSGPMLILLTLGAMNLLVMLLVTVMIAVEKLAREPGLIVRISGCAAVGAGLFMLVRCVVGM